MIAKVVRPVVPVVTIAPAVSELLRMSIARADRQLLIVPAFRRRWQM
jgi:hypothetical protein